MDSYVFLGPTMSAAAAGKYLDAVFCPPVQQGDILNLLPRKPRLIAIIDGYFELVPAVWHKEILYAMSRGVHVFGAASMGALRAAELHPFGMVGVGRVFESYHSNQIEDDDEVAVAHASAESGFRPISEAMVNIRDAVNAAMKNGLMTESLGSRFLSVAKDLHYSRRTFARLLEILRPELDPAQSSALRTFFDEHPKLKEVDAINLLQHCASFLASDPPPLQVDYSLERTVFLDAMINEAERNAAEAEARTDGDEEAQGSPRHEVLLRILARREATRLGMDCTEEELTEAARVYGEGLTFQSDAAILQAVRNAGIDERSFLSLMNDVTLLNKLDDFYDRDIGSQLPEHIRIRTFRHKAQNPNES